MLWLANQRTFIDVGFGSTTWKISLGIWIINGLFLLRRIGTGSSTQSDCFRWKEIYATGLAMARLGLDPVAVRGNENSTSGCPFQLIKDRNNHPPATPSCLPSRPLSWGQYPFTIHTPIEVHSLSVHTPVWKCLPWSSEAQTRKFCKYVPVHPGGLNRQSVPAEIFVSSGAENNQTSFPTTEKCT